MTCRLRICSFSAQVFSKARAHFSIVSYYDSQGGAQVTYTETTKVHGIWNRKKNDDKILLQRLFFFLFSYLINLTFGKWKDV